MEAKEREQVRAYVGAGLQSLWQDNTEDAQGNVMWAQLALQDLTQAKLLLPAQELAALDKTLEELGRTPKLRPMPRTPFWIWKASVVMIAAGF